MRSIRLPRLFYFHNTCCNSFEVIMLSFSESIQQLSETFLDGCGLNRMNLSPIGPHIIGRFETCCNSSALARAQSFFMQNHGNLSIILHPLTRYEVLDHTTRAMWLGKSMPLDISGLNEDLGPGYHNEDKCLPINLNVSGRADFIIPNNMIHIIVLYFVIYHICFEI